MKKLSVMVGMMVLSGCGGAAQLSDAQIAALKSQIESGSSSSGSVSSTTVTCKASDNNLGVAFGSVIKASYQVVTFSSGDRLLVCQYETAPGYLSTSGTAAYDSMSSSFTVYSPAGTNLNNECDLEYSNSSTNSNPGASGAYLQFTNPSSGVYKITFSNPSKPLGSYVGNVYNFTSCQ